MSVLGVASEMCCCSGRARLWPHSELFRRQRSTTPVNFNVRPYALLYLLVIGMFYEMLDVLAACRVICGAAAHLLPGKFKSHEEELKICVIMYYVLVTVNLLFSWIVTKENFLVVCASERHETPRVCFSLKLQRFATDFTLKLTGSQDR